MPKGKYINEIYVVLTHFGTMLTCDLMLIPREH